MRSSVWPRAGCDHVWCVCGGKGKGVEVSGVCCGDCSVCGGVRGGLWCVCVLCDRRSA